jgi:hypothetical protein
MKRSSILQLRSGVAIIGVGALIALTLALPAVAEPRSALGPDRLVAVLSLAPVQLDVPYAPIPSSENLAVLTESLRKSIRLNGIGLIQAGRIRKALRDAGFDQANVLRACVEVQCAVRIARSVGAHTVVVGLVTHATGVYWQTDVRVMSATSGREYGHYTGKVVGDVLSMERHEDVVGRCVAQLIRKQRPCRGDDPGPWM